MKALRKTLGIILLLALSVLCLYSCKIGGDKPDGGNTDGEGDDGSYIYKSDTLVNIIVNDTECSGEAPNVVLNALYHVLDSTPAFGGDELPDTGHEIIVGPSDREISKVAYRRLDRLDKLDEDTYFMLVYSDGNSVAIAYDPDERGEGATYAAKWLAERIGTNSTLKLRRGVLYNSHFDIDERYTEMDNAYRDMQWARLENYIGGETGAAFVEAMKEHYSIYDERVFSWLANLYEPTIGAFYYSNSARDNVGFLPDVESTSQALGFLESVGTLKQYYGGDWMNVLSEEQKTRLLNWVRGLQSPEDGYFYHPQWGKDITENRRARDLNWCNKLIKNRFGEKPLYNTPGSTGDGIYERGTEAALTGMLGGSAAVAVSSVISTATASLSDFPVYLRTTEAWKEYLESLNLRYNSYYACNMMSTLTSSIQKRDNLSESMGEGRPYRQIEMEWLISNQNPQTGCWDWNDPSSEGFSLYDGPNGLLKIYATFDAVKMVIPYAERALESCVKAIASDEPIGAITYIYNAYWAMAGVCNNLKNRGGDEGKALAEKTIAHLRAIAPEAIRGTTEKIIYFKRDDGSFSYGRNYSSSTSQGVTVCLSYQAEGDVNGNGIAINGVTGQMFEAFDLSSLRPIIFGDNCRRKFMNILNSLGPVIKFEGVDNREPLTFDDEPVGEDATGVEYALGGAEYGSYARILPDPREGAKGNVLDYYSAGPHGDTVRVNLTGNLASATCYVFQGDFCFEKASSSWKVAFQMGRTYNVTFRFDGDTVEIWDTSSEKSAYGVRHKLGEAKLHEWFNLRMEYYLGDADTVRCLAYINGELVSVNDNHYDLDGAKLKAGREPKIGTTYTFAGLYIPNGYSGHILCDNLCAYKTNDVYKPVTDPEKQPAFNIDAPDRERVTYTLEDGNIPSDFTVTSSGFSVQDLSGGKALSVKGVEKGNAPTMYFSSVQRTQATKTALFEADMLIPETASGNLLRLVFSSDDVVEAKAAAFEIKTVGEGAGKYAVICAAPTGVQGSPLGGVELPVGEVFNLRIEVNTVPAAATVYLNGEPVAITDNLTGNAAISYIERVTLSAFKNPTGEILLDNLVFERVKSSFGELTESVGSSKVHDFSNGFGEAEGGGSASVSGGAVKLPSTSAASLTVPFNKRSVLTDFNSVKTDLKIGSTAENANLFDISVLDRNGNIILKYEIRTSGGRTPGLYEVTEYGVCETPLLILPVNSTFRLTLEHYATEGMTLIYVGSELSAMSGIYYSESTATSGAASLVVSSEGCAITIDNVVAETLYKPYSKPKFEHSGKNPEDTAEKLTFESSSTGNYPSRLTLKLSTSGAESRIEGAFKRGVFGKVVSLSSTTGSGDYMLLDLTKKLPEGETATGVAFESDLLFKSGQTGVLFQLSLGGEAGTAYMYNVTLTSKGFVNLVETTHTTDGAKRQRTVVQNLMPIDGWFNLRVEYFYGDKDTVRINTYIDGTLYYTSTAFYDSHKSDTPKSGLTYARISALSNTVATVKADNMILEELSTPAPDRVGRPANPEDGNATLGFEYSDPNLLPSALTTSLSSAGAAIRVEEMLLNGVLSKALIFESGRGANDRLNFSSTVTVENATSARLSVDLALSSEQTGALYQMFLVSEAEDGAQTVAYMIQFGRTEEGVWRLTERTNTNGGASSSISLGDIVLRDNEWFNLGIGYHRSEDGVTIAVYVNGELVRVSEAFYNSHLSDAVAPSGVNIFRMSTLSDAAATACIDNFSLLEGTEEFTPPSPSQSEKDYYGKGVYLSDPATRTYSDRIVGFFTPSGDGSLSFDVKNGVTSANTYVFEADIRITSVTYSEQLEWLAYLYMTARNGATFAESNMTTEWSRPSIYSYKGKAYIASAMSGKLDSATGEPTGVICELEENVWYNLRLEVEQVLNSDGVTYSRFVRFFVNGVQYAGTTAEKTSEFFNSHLVRATLARRIAFGIDVDNVFVGGVGEPVGEQLEPVIGSVDYYGKGAYADRPETEKYSDQPNGYLVPDLGYMITHVIKATAGDDSVAADPNAIHVFETDIRIADFLTSGSTYWHLYLTMMYQSGVNAETGAPIYSKLQADSSRISLQTLGEYAYLTFNPTAGDSDGDGVVDSYRARLDVGVWHNLRIEQHRTRNGDKYSTTLYIYLNGSFIGKTDSGTQSAIGYPISHINMTTRREMTVELDNTFLGTVLPSATHPEDGRETVTLEDSSSSSLPSALTPSLSGSGSTVTVENILGSKALVLRSAKGNADSVSLSPTVSLEGATSARLSLELSLLCGAVGRVAEIALTSGGTVPFALEFHRGENGYYSLRTSGGTAVPLRALIKDGDPIALTVSYFKGETGGTVTVSLGGVTVYTEAVSDLLPDGAAVTLTTEVAILTLDNLALVQGTDSYLAPETDERDFYGKGVYASDKNTETFDGGILQKAGLQSLSLAPMNGRKKGDKIVLEADIRIASAPSDGVILTVDPVCSDGSILVETLSVVAREGRIFLTLDGREIAELIPAVWYNLSLEITATEEEGVLTEKCTVLLNQSAVATVATVAGIAQLIVSGVNLSGDTESLVDYDNVFLGVFLTATPTPPTPDAGEGGALDGADVKDEGGWTKS